MIPLMFISFAAALAFWTLGFICDMTNVYPRLSMACGAAAVLCCALFLAAALYPATPPADLPHPCLEYSK